MPPAALSCQSAAYATLHPRWTGAGWDDSLALSRPQIRLGRRPDNDIVLDNPALSGAHLELTLVGNTLYARDLGSRNGTVLDGKPLPRDQAVPLRAGAMLRLAGCLDLSLGPVAPEVGAAALPVRLLEAPAAGLVICERSKEVRQVAFPPGARRVRIGRATDNDIVIENSFVSASHAEIRREPDGSFTISDLGSRNGLLWQGRRIATEPLYPGEPLAVLDEVTITFRPDLGFVSATVPGAAPGREVATLDLAARAQVRLGRAPDNDVCLPDPQVSRYHAVIERLGMRYRIRDLRSDNGTFVNGVRVDKEAFLTEGDTIQLAGSPLRFAADGLEQVDRRDGLGLDLVDLTKTVQGGKTLLQHISLSIAPREFVAVVGTSGAGKSTLLDAMNGFRPATGGRVLVNGDDLYAHFDAYRTHLGYVPQEDIMHRELTVSEAFDYAARLRLPGDTSAAERRARTDQVLRELGLEPCRDLQIARLSGGQRKRVSIGAELLTRPRLFFLDEATSGLDPGTELELMTTLRWLTEDPEEARTVVLVTHATKNVMLCDKVVFLTRGGHLAFFGPPDEALKYFEGYRTQEQRRLKPDFEFDDIYLLIDPDHTLGPAAPEREKLWVAAQWAQRYRESSACARFTEGAPLEAPAGRTSPAVRRRPGASAWRQFTILLARNGSVVRHDRKTLAVLLAQAPLIGLLSFVDFGSHMFDRAQGSVERALTSLFMTVIVVMLFGTLNGAREFSKEIAVYRRERLVNLGIVPYVASKVVFVAALCLYQVAVYLLITQITVDWPRAELSEWGWTQIYLTVVLACLSGAMLGLVLSAFSSSDTQAVALIPIVAIPQMLFSGVLVPARMKTPVFPAVTSSRWACQALATLTRADRAGSEDPGVLGKVAAEQERRVQERIGVETDKALGSELAARVQAALPDAVRGEVERALVEQTAAAEVQAQVATEAQLAKATVKPAAAEAERLIAEARQKAAAQVAARRSEIEAAVRAKAEQSVQGKVAQAIAAEVAARVRAAADRAGLGEDANPVVQAARDRFPGMFSADVGADWLRLSAIMAGLLALILVLLKRKDRV